MSIEELLVAALSELAHDGGEQPLPYLLALHERGSREVSETAAALLDSSDELRRQLGVRVLRQLAHRGRRDPQIRGVTTFPQPFTQVDRT